MRFARFDEIVGDVWTIPAERTKTGNEHRVPLSPEALRVLEAAKIDSAQDYVFPSPRGKPMPDATMSRFMEREGYDARPHGFHVVHKPRLLSDNGSSYISGELAEWLQNKGMRHSRGAPYHPQTQGKIERWHQTLKNRILLENYFLPGDLEAQVEAFVDHYNHQRYHESLNNVTPSDVYFGRAQAILNKRERIKRKTLETRRLQHRKIAA